MQTGTELITEERYRQINEEGYDQQHDDEHDNGELSNAAAVYAIDPKGGDASIIIKNLWPRGWPLNLSCKGNTEDDIAGRIRDLVKAGALIAAEIDRLIRLQEKQELSTEAQKISFFNFLTEKYCANLMNEIDRENSDKVLNDVLAWAKKEDLKNLLNDTKTS